MQSDEQIEFCLNQVKEIVNDNDHSRSKKQKASELDDLEEQIKDRLQDPNLNFEDEYIEDVMRRLVELRGIDSLPT
jgi:hypothetical protein